MPLLKTPQMKEAKEFILKFFATEAECWTKRELGDVDKYNKSVQELYSMADESMNEAFGIILKSRLRAEENPVTHVSGYIFKIGEYKHKTFGKIWVAYTSYENPIASQDKTSLTRAFIISEINGELKIVGAMSVALNQFNLKPTGWKGSVYNPSDLDIDNLGEFVAVERYAEPENYDDFSLNEYLKDK